MLRTHLNFRNWLKSMEQTKTVLKKSPRSAFSAVSVRYCAEVKKKNEVGFVEGGARREIRFIPEIAAKECNSCKECFELCPTSYLQAAFVLTESLSLSRDSSPTE